MTTGKKNLTRMSTLKAGSASRTKRPTKHLTTQKSRSLSYHKVTKKILRRLKREKRKNQEMKLFILQVACTETLNLKPDARPVLSGCMKNTTKP